MEETASVVRRCSLRSTLRHAVHRRDDVRPEAVTMAVTSRHMIIIMWFCVVLVTFAYRHRCPLSMQHSKASTFLRHFGL